MNRVHEQMMNLMSEQTMTNWVRLNLDVSLAEAYKNAPYPWNLHLQQPRQRHSSQDAV